MTAIETFGLTKEYRDKTAVNTLELKVEAGELFALLGVNGAGKTTTIKMLSCLTPPTAGDAVLLGDSIVTKPFEVKKKIAVSPQETAVARKLSVLENLVFTAKIHGFTGKEAAVLAEEKLDAFGLTEVARKGAGILSGGMQRRLSIAMALISEPQILFLDEPTLGLDVIARRELWREIEKLKGKITVILTTHYMEEAEALSDRLAIMANGSLRAVGTAAELIARSGAKDFEDAFIRIATENDAITHIAAEEEK